MEVRGFDRHRMMEQSNRHLGSNLGFATYIFFWLSKFLNLSVPQFPDLQNGNDNITYLIDCCEDELK